MNKAAKSSGKKSVKDTGVPFGLPSYMPVAILAALTVVFFWCLITPVSSARHYLWEDFLYYYYPVRMFAAHCISLNQFPFWNPYVFGGQPFFADIQTSVLYPFNLLHSLLSGSQMQSFLLLESIQVLHFFLAGFFTFRFLRLTRVNMEGALLGAITFAFSGYLVTHAIHTTFVCVFIWIPLALELLERSLTGGKFRHVIACAAVLAVSTAGGYPQYNLYLYYVLGLYWLIHEIYAAGQHGFSFSVSSRRAAILLLITGAALGANMVSWLPAAELSAYTPRSEMTYEASVEHSLEPRMLLKLVAPRFFGTQYPAGNTYWAGGYGSFWETCLFVGLLPLALALYGIKGALKNRHAVFPLALTVLCLWLALGKYGGLYKLFFSVAPGFGEFRHPGRFAGLVSLGLALLAARGWTLLAREQAERGASFLKNRMFAILAVLLLAVGGAVVWAAVGIDDPARAVVASSGSLASLAWFLPVAAVLSVAAYWRGQSVKLGRLGLLACLLVFGELYWFGVPSISGNTSPERMYQHSSTVRSLVRDGESELFRINARSLENPSVMVLRRNQGSIHNLFLLEGYNPLQLARRLNDVEKERQFDLLNVKYSIYIDYEKQKAGLEPRTDYLPRAWLLGRWRVLDDDAAILATLNDPVFDHRSEALLEAVPGIEADPSFSAERARAEIETYTPAEIVVSTSCDAASILMLGEWHYPAWKVYVDGREAVMLRADYALRAVALPPGAHRVQFIYSSDSFRTGLLISLASIAGLLLAGVVSLKLGKF